MCEFVFSPFLSRATFFVFGISIATVSVFPFLALYFKAPIPLFHIQQLFQPKPHALFFLTFALFVFKNGFFFLIALSLSFSLFYSKSNYYYYYYCKVYLEKSFVHNTITILL